jgi:hypothetical protein
MAKERNLDGPCKDCIYWESIEKTSDVWKGRIKKTLKDAGVCNRYPPKPLADNFGCWPTTKSIDWCGEYQPKA